MSSLKMKKEDRNVSLTNIILNPGPKIGFNVGKRLPWQEEGPKI